MFPITVVNKHHGVAGEYIGRDSPLGNPFTHQPVGTHAKYVLTTREEAVANYAKWLQEQIHTMQPSIITELDRLADKAMREPINLVCFCAPKSCHGDVIKEVLIAAINNYESKQKMTKPIDSFSGEYRFLSNFWMAPITFNEIDWPSVEHLYQAAKSLNQNDCLTIWKCKTPGQAKRAGQKITIRNDWDKVKLDAMTQFVTAKFEQNPQLMEKLLATGNAELIEGNTWGDTYWGVCKSVGTNHLGKILMAIRTKHSD